MEVDVPRGERSNLAVKLHAQRIELEPAPLGAQILLAALDDGKLRRIEAHKPGEGGVDLEGVATESQPIRGLWERLQRAVPFAADQTIDDAQIIALGFGMEFTI